ncbi:multicopper oxidase [Truncatella angustata]|uniref:laccase n=1 Tax=Truncatella angustata TaxID=152316 RepID=A0A9P8RHC9_9PEZI|nr:multicopper oxidase [Truncatella angustata]KAH6646044.1 multicopper oxidase [Truncatella angustata]
MRAITLAGAIPIFSFLAAVTAAPATGPIELRQSASCNTPDNRACWSDGFDINTDYELSTPEGVTRTFDFDVIEADNWTGPDGVVKEKVMLINNQYPGPALYADWGDTLVITVTNSMTTNGTSIHWHGLRQHHTNIHDGANGVTECPIAPGQSKTYTFRATQYGTSWYHSHHSAQYGNGVFGSIHINGPASANYDVDLGVYPIFDYYHLTADQGVRLTQTQPLPPNSDNVLFNGTNINPADPSLGQYSIVTLTPGAKHRLRLINPSIEHNFQVSLVGHEFTIIATDFVPVEPVVAGDVFLGVGQRYDVIIEATEAVDNYWFNVTLSSTGLCGASDNVAPAAVFRYDGAADALPTDPGTAPADSLCNDRDDLVPIVTRAASVTEITPAVLLNDNLPVTLSFPPLSSTVTWFVNGSAIDVQWDRPVLEYVLEGDAASLPRRENVVVVDQEDVWTYWIIQNLSPVPHPMHLHGHDFLVLGRSAPLNVPFSLAQLLALLAAGQLGPLTDLFDPSDLASLNFDNPTRRDVTMLPGLGYLVVAFRADNPGNWLLHCHIAWHVSGGLSVDFVERRDEQAAFISEAELTAFEDTCTQWRSFYATSEYQQEDSGL